MKKVILLIFILLYTFSFSEMNLKVGFSISENGYSYKLDNTELSDNKSDGSYFLSFEAGKEITNRSIVGMGIEYGKLNDLNGKYTYLYQDKNFNIIDGYRFDEIDLLSLYGYYKYNIYVDDYLSVYTKMYVGGVYAVNNNSFNNSIIVEDYLGNTNIINKKEYKIEADIGLLYGVGIGAEYKDMIFELGYRSYNLEGKINEDRQKIGRDMWIVSIGIKL